MDSAWQMVFTEADPGRARLHPLLNGEDGWTHRKDFRELPLEEHLQLPLLSLNLSPSLQG